MPDLPGSNPEKDKRMFEQVLNGEDLQVSITCFFRFFGFFGFSVFSAKMC